MPLYDTIGAGYAKSRLADVRIVDALCEAIHLPPNSTVLDVGAGTGKYARALAERGVTRLSADLASGAWERRYPGMRLRSSLDVGYRFIVAEAPKP